MRRLREGELTVSARVRGQALAVQWWVWLTTEERGAVVNRAWDRLRARNRKRLRAEMARAEVARGDSR